MSFIKYSGSIAAQFIDEQNYLDTIYMLFYRIEYPCLVPAHRPALLPPGRRLGGDPQALPLPKGHIPPLLGHGRKVGSWPVPD